MAISSITSLPLTKPLTATQVRVTAVRLPLSKAPHSEELRSRLGVTDEHLTGRFSDRQIYEVLSVTSDGNAMLLLSQGYETRTAALEYLTANGFHDLIVDTAEFVAQAMDRRISAIAYILRADIRRKSGPNVLDALEVAGSVSLGDTRTVVDGVLRGTISLTLIKKLGSVRLSKISGSAAVDALTAVTSGNTPLTPLGLRRALQRRTYGEGITTDSIKLGLKYGDRAVDISVPYRAMRMDKYLMENRPEFSMDDRFSVIEFSSKIASEELFRKNIPNLSEENLLLFFESGASADEVLDGTITLEQAKAIRDGMPASVSSGVL